MKMRTLRVSALIKLLQTYDQDALVVVPAFDHSYRTPSVSFCDAALINGELSEHPGCTPEQWAKDNDETFKELRVVVIS